MSSVSSMFCSLVLPSLLYLVLCQVDMSLVGKSGVVLLLLSWVALLLLIVCKIILNTCWALAKIPRMMVLLVVARFRLLLSQQGRLFVPLFGQLDLQQTVLKLRSSAEV